MLQLLDVLSIFDWITPTKGFVEDFINDPTLLQANSWTFFIPLSQSDYAPSQIKSLMAKHGIHSWGHQITGGEYFFSVKREQAQWAEYILGQKSIPLWYASQGAPRPDERPLSWGQFFRMSEGEKQTWWDEETDKTREQAKWYKSLYDSRESVPQVRVREEQSLMRSAVKFLLWQ